MKKDILKFGIIGLGNIGTGVVRNFLKNRSLIQSRSGIKIELARIADIDLRNRNLFNLDDRYFTKNAQEIIEAPDIPIVVELVGGTTAAKEFVIRSIEQKKKIVTANKALLAEFGRDIIESLKQNPGSEIFFEASVGGGIPVIKVLREGFIGNEIKEITAIINGTANYVLTAMENNNITFNKALQSAQEKGFAEPDPVLDIEGIDSAHKIAILGSIAFGSWIDYKKIHIEGISKITIQDIEFAKRLGYKIKLLAIARKENGIEVRVNPALLDFHHPLASVEGSNNAVYIKGFPVGESMLYGKGAGDNPTSSAVMSDIVDAAKSVKLGALATQHIFNRIEEHINFADKMLWEARYYVRIQAQDKPGVLASVAGIFAKYNISISAVLQQEESTEETVPVVMMTHKAIEKNMLAACREIEKLSFVKGNVTIIRVLTQNQ